ncbi:galanin receptor 2a-like [Oculina patagonica]
MTTNDNISPLMFIIFLVFYSTVFIISIVGNTWVLVTCYKSMKRNRDTPLMWLVANLASADLLFTFLTILNAVSFVWRWVGGDTTCKLQGFLIETSYTTSITTLVIISYQRLKAITDPFNARTTNWSNKEYIKIVIIWVSCLAVCSPLAHVYRVETKDGRAVCANTTWGPVGRQIYYSLHAIFFFAIPLLYMIFTQRNIFRALRTRVLPIRNSFITRSNHRHKKVARTLAALTTAFVFCWSPFMITRTLLYFYLVSPGLVWRGSQLLICLNAALDPLLYGFYGGNLKSALRRVLRCNYRGSESDASTMIFVRTQHSLALCETHTINRISNGEAKATSKENNMIRPSRKKI